MSKRDGTALDNTAKKVKSGEVISDKIEIPAFTVSRTIHPNITTEILSYLPALSLLKFLCVCKSWAHIIEDENFVAKHLERGGWLLYSDPSEIIRNPFDPVTSKSGLILERDLVSKLYRIRNPTTHQMFELPHLPNLTNGKMKLAYAHSTGHYKVICFNEKQDSTPQCYVFTLGSNQVSWRMLKIPFANCFSLASFGLSVHVLGEDVHYIRGGKSPSYFIEIISLDLRSECFSFNTLPRTSFMGSMKICRASWNGCLAFVGVFSDKLHVFVLEDYKNHQWSERQRLGPLFVLYEIPYLVPDLVFVDKRNQILCFSFQGGHFRIQYDFDDETVEFCDPLFEGIETRYIRRTLVSFKGMRSE